MARCMGRLPARRRQARPAHMFLFLLFWTSAGISSAATHLMRPCAAESDPFGLCGRGAGPIGTSRHLNMSESSLVLSSCVHFQAPAPVLTPVEVHRTMVGSERSTRRRARRCAKTVLDVCNGFCAQARRRAPRVSSSATTVKAAAKSGSSRAAAKKPASVSSECAPLAAYAALIALYAPARREGAGRCAGKRRQADAQWGAAVRVRRV
jgi:hypothetical protein